MRHERVSIVQPIAIAQSHKFAVTHRIRLAIGKPFSLPQRDGDGHPDGRCNHASWRCRDWHANHARFDVDTWRHDGYAHSWRRFEYANGPWRDANGYSYARRSWRQYVYSLWRLHSVHPHRRGRNDKFAWPCSTWGRVRCR
jgi:hypothetical protein